MTDSRTPGEPSWADVLALVEKLDSSGLAEAEITVPGLQVRVSRTALPPAPTEPPAAAAPRATTAAVPEPAAPPTGQEVTAPMLGVVYHRPAPDKEPFVAVGDHVDEDTTVAVIEVMKMMNTVAAGVAGTVTEICVADAQMVEHGDVLLRVEAAR